MPVCCAVLRCATLCYAVLCRDSPCRLRLPAVQSRTVLSRLLWPPWEGEPVFCTLRSRKQCEVHWCVAQLIVWGW